MGITLSLIVLAATQPQQPSAPARYQLLSFAECGPPMSGGSICNDDPKARGPAISAILRKCHAESIKSLEITDGWIGFSFDARKRVFECVRSQVPASTRIELTTDRAK